MHKLRDKVFPGNDGRGFNEVKQSNVKLLGKNLMMVVAVNGSSMQCIFLDPIRGHSMIGCVCTFSPEMMADHVDIETNTGAFIKGNKYAGFTEKKVASSILQFIIKLTKKKG